MANQEQLARLKQGVQGWNKWRKGNPNKLVDLARAHLEGADLEKANLRKANLTKAHLEEAELTQANLTEANLTEANLTGAILAGANLAGANLTGATLHDTDLMWAKLPKANLAQAVLWEPALEGANLTGAILAKAELRGVHLAKGRLAGANLAGASLVGVNLEEANLRGADLTRADLTGADLGGANLRGADLSGANLGLAILVGTHLEKADLTGCHVYGVSAWDVHQAGAKQTGLVITPEDTAEITVDDLEIAQFIYLLLNNKKLRSVIDTIGNKAILILGRFTPERKLVLDAIRSRLRELGYLPMVFDFEKPASKDFTETVKTLAGMSAFIVADITAPKSVPQEAQAVIPDYMVPFVPIIEAGQQPWAMFQDLWVKHRDWVFEPLEYGSVQDLRAKFRSAVVQPALERRSELMARRAEAMGRRSLDDFHRDEDLAKSKKGARRRPQRKR